MTPPKWAFGAILPDRAGAAGAIGLTEADLVPDVPIQVATTGVQFVYVALKDAAAVDRAVSERDRLSSAFADGVFLFTAVGRDRLYSRMFAPHVMGIHEDPATGSGSGPLGAFAVRYGLVPGSAAGSLISERGAKMGRRR